MTKMIQNKQLNGLRKQIDAVDRRLICDITKRLKIARLIGVEKKRLNLPISNQKREAEVLSKTKLEFMKSIFKLLIDESKRIQI